MSSRRSGRLFQTSEGTVLIVYNDQPLKQHNKVVLHKTTMIKQAYVPLVIDGQEQKIVKSLDKANELMKGGKLIGFID